MKTSFESNAFVIKNKIYFQIEKSFLDILEMNAIEELDILDKNISINPQNIEYSLTELNYHQFKTPVFNDLLIEIGSFTLVYSDENELIDEFFVIY
ncbi:hypothetical protein EG240_11990 [Paenimyroides tangerinum]|uniref:Uncharacterized protein n=1 Tax=Paenimyroides tangerinum TaxID=2488728 RepID=A0A3P3W2M7_9FLAO|nr:hypothetical protein [Paenimyroides tangerinum]RRJ89352.1 hypothetical protein EG240_11990 [Paenimyroides tangerinum]